MNTKTIAQKRAEHALRIIHGENNESRFSKKSAEKQKKLNSYISSFGPMILMNSFGQACAFYLANKEEEYQSVYLALESWLTSAGRPYEDEQTQGLMNAITSRDAIQYRLAQAEALAYLDWLKKFAKAFLKSDSDTASQHLEEHDD